MSCKSKRMSSALAWSASTNLKRLCRFCLVQKSLLPLPTSPLIGLSVIDSAFVDELETTKAENLHFKELIDKLTTHLQQYQAAAAAASSHALSSSSLSSSSSAAASMGGGALSAHSGSLRRSAQSMLSLSSLARAARRSLPIAPLSASVASAATAAPPADSKSSS